MIDDAFWAQQRVLVTGHTGFKGAWLSMWLSNLGAEVAGLSLPPATEPSMFELCGIANRTRSVFGSIVDAGVVEQVVAQCSPTVVVHMAAQALVRPSYDDPVETFHTNVVGTAQLLWALRSAPELRAVVSVTSDKCYENREWHWGYREIDPMGGFDPYSASKGCAELVTAAMRRSFYHAAGSAGVASARAGNVIGGGDWAPDRLIPDIIRAFADGRPVVIRRPESVRPWQHVLEPLRGYLAVAQALAGSSQNVAGAWNFGPDESDARSVEWIVANMADRWGDGASYRIEREGPHEARLLKLDCSKAKAELGWQPVLDLETALDWVVEWYRAQRDGSDMAAVTLGQIDRFSRMAADRIATDPAR